MIYQSTRRRIREDFNLLNIKFLRNCWSVLGPSVHESRSLYHVSWTAFYFWTRLQTEEFTWPMYITLFLLVKGPAADARGAPQPWGFLCNPMMKTMMMMMIIFFVLFLVMEHQGKPKYSGEKPVPMPLCPPQIPHGLTRDRTRACAVGGRRLTAWAMARPLYVTYNTRFVLCMGGGG
jgi:hypothetical protein